MITIVKRVPVWGGSVVENYKQMFKSKYGRDTTCPDEVIWYVYENVFDDSDNKKQDEWRVAEIKELESRQITFNYPL